MKKMVVFLTAVLVVAFTFAYKVGDWFASDEPWFTDTAVSAVAMSLPIEPIEPKGAEQLKQTTLFVMYSFDFYKQAYGVTLGLISDDKNFKADKVNIYIVDSKDIKLVRTAKNVSAYNGMVVLATNVPALSITQYITVSKLVELIGNLTMGNYIMVEVIRGSDTQVIIYSTNGLMKILVYTLNLVSEAVN